MRTRNMDRKGCAYIVASRCIGLYILNSGCVGGSLIIPAKPTTVR